METQATIETAVTPPITLTLGDVLPGGGPPEPPSLVMRLLKPKVTLQSPFGSTRIAPAGEPGAWQAGVVVVAVVVLALFFAIGWIARRF